MFAKWLWKFDIVSLAQIGLKGVWLPALYGVVFLMDILSTDLNSPNVNIPAELCNVGLSFNDFAPKHLAVAVRLSIALPYYTL